jgi:hypothetical protein
MQFRPMLKTIGTRGFFFLVFLSGCFQGRSPELPADNTGWVSPTEVSILMENLQKSVSTLNLNNYRRCLLSEKYVFYADPDVAANNQGLFSGWNWDKENQFFNNLIVASQPLSSGNSFTLSAIRNNNLGADSVELTADYAMAVYHQDSSFKAVNFRGLLTLQLKRNAQNEWQILQWRDNKTGSGTCLSELKQHFFAP